METREDYYSKLEIYEDAYSSNEPFNSAEIGFHIAAAVTDYTNSTELIEDPTYGEIVLLRKSWDNTEATELQFTQLKHKKCEENDFNWGDGRPSDENSSFFPLSDQALVDIKVFGNRLKCFDDEVDMFGNYDASAASNLMVAFMMCDPESGLECKNSTEISEWLKNKYILTLVNE